MRKKWEWSQASIIHFILTALGLMIIAESVQIGFGTLRRPGSGLFPFLCGIILFLLNIFPLIYPPADKPRVSLFTNKDENKTFLFFILTFFSWILLMPYLGWLVITFFVTLSFSKILRLEGWKKPILLSLTNTALSYFLFDYCLYLDLPRGFGG
jgi:putative tricarboxylic transport membrane protein